MAAEQKLLFTFYGDDFTGSTDALEALSLQGIPTVLFLGLPDAIRIAEFSECHAIGVAGESRSKSPEWMSAHLAPIFERIKQWQAPVCQYKVCSTFDSSPMVGSIGRALEIGQDIFSSPYVPIVASAPRLGRWLVFANLFAAADGEVYRIDRHPTMSRHPVTPMKEGDLRLHLQQQTARTIASLDVLAIESEDGGRRRLAELVKTKPSGVLFDALDDKHLRKISELVWELRLPFVIGSSGFTSGMAAYLSESGTPEMCCSQTPGKARQLVVMSGSGSPVTERQIRWALANGFSGIRLPVRALMEPSESTRNRATVLAEALGHLHRGQNLVLYSALGPSDCAATDARDELGRQMGLLLREILVQSGVKRALIAGGDTSSHAGQQLGIYALTMISALAPGAPLCRAHSEEKALSGLELVLKGGQVGGEDFFGSVLLGRV